MPRMRAKPGCAGSSELAVILARAVVEPGDIVFARRIGDEREPAIAALDEVEPRLAEQQPMDITAAQVARRDSRDRGIDAQCLSHPARR